MAFIGHGHDAGYFAHFAGRGVYPYRSSPPARRDKLDGNAAGQDAGSGAGQTRGVAGIYGGIVGIKSGPLEEDPLLIRLPGIAFINDFRERKGGEARTVRFSLGENRCVGIEKHDLFISLVTGKVFEDGEHISLCEWLVSRKC